MLYEQKDTTFKENDLERIEVRKIKIKKKKKKKKRRVRKL
jgi:hypothetical protein